MVNSKPHILIVDDEKGLRVGTQRLLESDGYTVDSAENGITGIKLGTGTEFDLAIIDLKMPDVDGLEVLQQIKKKLLALKLIWIIEIIFKKLGHILETDELTVIIKFLLKARI